SIATDFMPGHLVVVEAVPHGSEGGSKGAEEHPTSLGIDNRKVAMWAFLGSECMFFGALIATYLLFHTHTGDGPTPHQIYNIPYTSVSSFVLLMSSLTMVLALAAIQRGDHRGLRIWLLATAFLGLAEGGARRPVLALRRRGVDRDLHRRLPDPVGEEMTAEAACP